MPFYFISGQKSQLKQSRQTIYAGVKFEEDGYPRPTAAGRYCEWQHITVDKSNDIETFEEYKKTLKLECEPGEPDYLNWTVSFDTPNLVYYQVRKFIVEQFIINLLKKNFFSHFKCYTHNNLGWKIHVVNPGTTLHRNGSSLSNLSIMLLLMVLSTKIVFRMTNYS